MYAVLRRITVQPHFVEESVQRIEHGLMPLLSNEPGFVELYVVRVGEGEGVSISIFETKEQAEEGNRKSLEWAKEQIFPLALGPAEIVGVGEILLHQKKGTEEQRTMS
jgi:heme-degrading monooxygenase HmoA